MPNWCSNFVTFKHSDSKMINRVKNAVEKGRLFDEFVPVPKELLETISGSYGDSKEQADLEAQMTHNRAKYGYANWYDFAVEQWGTKWDVTDSHVTAKEKNSISIFFDSAWGPPLAFYDKMHSALEFEVDAIYYEPGAAFCGQYINGEDTDYNLHGETSESVELNIPKNIDQTFNISGQMAEYEAEEEND